MTRDHADKQWEYPGKTDPYWAVLTSGKFRRDCFNQESLKEFFESRVDHINGVLKAFNQHVDPSLRPTKALDSVCRVGRILIPVSKIWDSVVGVDVFPAILGEARNNFGSVSIKNVRLILDDDSLSQITRSFYFIHSFIVFQHIPGSRGLLILRRLLDPLDENGVGALHFTCFSEYFVFRRISAAAQRSISFLMSLRNWVRGEPLKKPFLQMNA